MITINEFTNPVTQVINWLVTSTIETIPTVIAALVILGLGWIIGGLVGKVVKKGLKKVGVDAWFEEKKLKKAIFGVSVEGTLSSFIKWYIVLLFAEQATLQVNLTALSNFVHSIIVWLPQGITGVIFLGGVLILADWLRDKIKESNMGTELVGTSVYVFLIYIGIVIALPKFGFTEISILTDAFKYIIAGLAGGLALAIGIGFGAALKKPAEGYLKKWLK